MNAADHRILGLNRIFPEKELTEITNEQALVLSTLSYFATSLFDKKNVDDVLWDITQNCISRLGLEDCVIYVLDNQKSLLVQKAAFGNKNPSERKILSPMTIPLGKGITGAVAASGKPEIVEDTAKDPRYIRDDMARRSELCVPIFLAGKVMGVIDSEHSNPAFFKNFHLFLFELIAKLAAKKLEHILENKKSRFTNDNAYFKKFRFLLEKKKIYKNENLSLIAVAEQLDISSNYLSQLINSLCGFNFPELINRYRVEEAKEALIHPNFATYTVEGIGYESGFNSKSAFYSAFKKQTGSTPVEFRENHSS